MNSSSDASDNQEDIRASLESIVGISERWLAFLVRRQKRVRQAKAFLTAVLVWAAFSAVVVAIVLDQYSLAFFSEHLGIAYIILAFLLSVGGICGAVAYTLLGRRESPKLRELSELIARTKVKRGVDGNGEEATDQGIAGTALLETEKLLDLLPQMVRTRNQDSLLFGVVAFVLASIVAHPPVGIPVGVIVWLYFRYETNRTYDKQISKIDEQRRIFEQRKEEFLANL